MAERWKTTVRRSKLSTEEKENVEKAVEGMLERKTQALKSTAEYQQRARMSKEQRGREAIEWLAKDVIRIQTAQGKEVSWDAARKMMETIANSAERKTSK